MTLRSSILVSFGHQYWSPVTDESRNWADGPGLIRFAGVGAGQATKS